MKTALFAFVLFMSTALGFCRWTVTEKSGLAVGSTLVSATGENSVPYGDTVVCVNFLQSLDTAGPIALSSLRVYVHYNDTGFTAPSPNVMTNSPMAVYDVFDNLIRSFPFGWPGSVSLNYGDYILVTNTFVGTNGTVILTNDIGTRVLTEDSVFDVFVGGMPTQEIWPGEIALDLPQPALKIALEWKAVKGVSELQWSAIGSSNQWRTLVTFTNLDSDNYQFRVILH